MDKRPYLTLNIILMKKYILTFLLLIVLMATCLCQPDKPLTANPPKLTEYVNDLTGTLEPDDINLLRLKLRRFYDSTSTQIVVLLLPSLNGEPIEMVANSIYHHNGIGGKGKDNGALLLISKGERKIRIEVGYGLEGVLTDAMSKQIIQKEIGPELKKDNYYKGIDNAVNSIIALSKGEYTKDKSTDSSKESSAIWIVLLILFPVFIVIIIIAAVLRKRGGYSSGRNDYSGTNYYSSGSDSSSSWSSSDSSSSGSDSGFSGDGGDSGGGGASGDY